MKTTLSHFQIDDILISALKEDINSEDYSTNAIFTNGQLAKVELIAKEDGILAGLDVFQRVFSLYDDQISFNIPKHLEDGYAFSKGEVLLEVVGNIRSLLSCERVALNFMQRMSGVATLTKVYVEELNDPKIKVFDTRKTTPNLRLFEKYAVRVGGGYNHRYNLSDGILLKDNHINAVGSVKGAIEKARAYAPFVKLIEIEVESLEEVKEAVEAGADIIMLDNMDVELIKQATDLINSQAIIEVSGNVSLDNIANYRGLDIDYISSGSLTHNYRSIDLSMKNLTYLD